MTTALADLKVLALDCQATGANPDKGRLLEIGWTPARACAAAKPERLSIQSYLLRLPPDTEIPPAVKRLTGITDTAMTDSVPTDIVWRHLIEAAQAIAAENQSVLCPTVIHFARFEEPFLRELHSQRDPGYAFPFQLICTHAIASRLLPDLPRRGIRALAGYFGHSMPELKRSADHAAATVSIWKIMVELLQTGCNVSTLQQLTEWLAATPPPDRSKRTFPMNSEILRRLPDKPGIYRMKRSNGDLLYIGKAKSLKQRVNSYFRPNAPHAEHILEMLTQASGLDFSLTGSALEAAVLETDEIKQHTPPYNIALRHARRNLVFCTKDLSRCSSACDEHFTIGPLPGGRMVDALSALGMWLNNAMSSAGDDHNGIGYAILALPPANIPEIRCLREGFDIFRRRYLNQFKNQSALRTVTGLGVRLWRDHRFPQQQAEAEPEIDSENDDADNERVWTPADIAGVIESRIMRSAHLIRRARWFCLLRDSSLAWTSAAEPDGYKRVVVFENGFVRHRDDLGPGEETPIPPGFARSGPARRKDMDLITYDRLRVTTTELRRLIAADRHIELRLSPDVSLNRLQLEQVLRWV